MNQQLPMPQQEELHLQDYLNVLVRRKYTFLFTFFAIVGAVTLFIFLVTPAYESVATLYVKDDKGKVGQMGDLLLNSPAAVDSEIEILKSRSNAEKVVAKLHLDWIVDDKSDKVDFKLLEFSSTAKEPKYEVELLGGGAYAVRDDDGNAVGTGKSDMLLRGKGVSLLLAGLKGEKGERFRLTLLPFNATVESLRKRIKVAEVGKKTNLISIAYRNRDPLLARDVVNTLVQAYLDQGVALKSEEASRTVSFVTDQLKGVKTELEGAEKNLAAYKSETGVVQLDAEAQDLIKTLSDAEKQKAEVTLRRKQAEFALASLKSARHSGSVYSPAVPGDDPVLGAMASKLSELEVQKKGLLAESTENHPGVKLVQSQIDELQKKIQATYETALQNALKQEEQLTRDIAARDAQLKRLPVAERDLARLMRLAKVNSDIYTFLLQKHEEARIAQASTINNISIVDPAITADKPAFPRKARTLAVGILVGLLVGVGLAFFRDYLDDSMRSLDEAKKTFSLPLLAVIPLISKRDGVPAMVTHNAPKSPASEAFRVLRTGLHFSALNRDKKVMLVTSSLPGEGKSTVAANLAITLAQTGAKTLIVDCDLRRSTQHGIFDLAPGPGLTELLVGQTTAADAVDATAVSGLDLLRAGTVPPNPAELLGSEAMQRFMDEMKGFYDHIVIDAPPVVAVTDAPVLCRLADLVLVVCQTGRVPAKVGQRTRENLAAVSAPLAGLVVSDRSASLNEYGYGYGYGYGYVADGKKRNWLRLGRSV